MEKICPSCGFTFNPEEPDGSMFTEGELCWYCWYRGRIGASKLIILTVMRDTGNTFRTKEEITIEVNKMRRRKIKVHTVYQFLHRYSKYYNDAKERRNGYLLLVHKKRRGKHQRGGIRRTYKISNRLLIRLNKYEKRWKLGLPINIKVSSGKKFKLTSEFKLKARAIRERIRNNEYDLYEYLYI